MGTSMTAVVLMAGVTLGLGKTYPPTRGAYNPRSTPNEILTVAVPLGSDDCRRRGRLQAHERATQERRDESRAGSRDSGTTARVVLHAAAP